MRADIVTAMLATLGGFLALLLGLLLLLLPLLASELSRARDSVWGAVVLLLGLVLVTSADRLTGAPMLAVLCGGLLIGRLGVEVGQARWRLLSDEERRRLWSWERWQTSLSQIGASMARLVEQTGAVVSGLSAWLAERRAARPTSTKRWVRPETDGRDAAAPAGEGDAATAAGAEPSAATTGEAGTGEAASLTEAAALTEAEQLTEAELLSEAEPSTATETLTETETLPLTEGEPVVVASFEEIDALLEQTIAESPAGGREGKGLGEAG